MLYIKRVSKTFCNEKFRIIRPRVLINRFTLSSSFLFFNRIANYKYCCRGLYCSGCPMRLYVSFGEQRILVHKDVPMDCQERYFNTSFDTFLQEGTYQINVSNLNLSYLFYIIKQTRDVGVLKNVKSIMDGT